MKTLKELREDRCLTQCELAESIEAKQAAVSFWENGQRFPSKDWRKKLAIALELTPAYITEAARATKAQREAKS